MSLPQSLRPEVLRLRTAVDKATSNREQYVDKFCRNVDKDIFELGKEVKGIKNQGLVRAEHLSVHSCMESNIKQQRLTAYMYFS